MAKPTKNKKEKEIAGEINGVSYTRTGKIYSESSFSLRALEEGSQALLTFGTEIEIKHQEKEGVEKEYRICTVIDHDDDLEKSMNLPAMIFGVFDQIKGKTVLLTKLSKKPCAKGNVREYKLEEVTID